MGSRRPSSPPVELWGGIECTHARIGARRFDQLDRSGHLSRPGDLDLIADLGISALRYPVLWERVAPDGDLATADWAWTDERLGRLRELGVRPIAGLLHHGNGPSDVDLLDPAFPERFAAFAAAVAERYPWIDAYLPINEPLTTARFCGLYAFWYPHRADAASFARILHHQLRGSILAMEAIRDVNPDATFIQNEDIGKVHATPTLAYEAEVQNERRWLTFDLLAGRVTAEHPMWATLAEGISTPELEAYAASPFPPDVVGFDHYVTSERFLDEALEPYPTRYHAGNERHVYADVEAVWSLSEGPVGVERLLQEAWDRYRMPIALTEVHLGGTREEQIRWLVESYEAAVAVCARGGDVRAVTAWSLLGMYDWNTLLMDPSGFYESGAFDVRGGTVRRTALADTIAALARGDSYAHPVLAVPGWWRRPERLIFRHEQAPAPEEAAAGEVRTSHGVVDPERADVHTVGRDAPSRRSPGPRLALVTNGGAIADAFRTACASRGLPVEEIEVGAGADPVWVHDAVSSVAPWGVIDAVGFAGGIGVTYEEQVLGRGLRDRDVASSVATHAAVSAAAERAGVGLVIASSWTVFAGNEHAPRFETELADAKTTLGRAWRRAEDAVRAAAPHALVVRPGPLLGSPLVPLDRPRNGRLAVAPAFAPDVANVALDLLIDGEDGIWHLANAGLAGVHPGASLRTSCVLGTSRAVLLPSLDDALARAAGMPHLVTPEASEGSEDEVDEASA
jgi:dTDP-4-dehydrorhamnose reductase